MCSFVKHYLNRRTWHLNATDYLQEIGVVNLRLKTRLAQEYIQRKLKKVFLTFTKKIKTYLQKIDNQQLRTIRVSLNSQILQRFDIFLLSFFYIRSTLTMIRKAMPHDTSLLPLILNCIRGRKIMVKVNMT